MDWQEKFTSLLVKISQKVHENGRSINRLETRFEQSKAVERLNDSCSSAVDSQDSSVPASVASKVPCHSIAELKALEEELAESSDALQELVSEKLIYNI